MKPFDVFVIVAWNREMVLSLKYMSQRRPRPRVTKPYFKGRIYTRRLPLSSIFSIIIYSESGMTKSIKECDTEPSLIVSGYL